MSNICSEELAPKIAAFNKLVDAGKLCELAGFDSVLEQLCKTGAQSIVAETLEPVDIKILCAVFCCCKSNGGDKCASETMTAVDRDMDWESRYKSEVSFNMRAKSPKPLMKKDVFGGLTTEPLSQSRGDKIHMKNRIEKENPGHKPAFKRNTRRPDIVIVRDPSQPPTSENIARVVDFKFTENPNNPWYEPEQPLSYHMIDPNKKEPLKIDDKECNCGNDDRKRSYYEILTAAKEAEDAQVSVGERVGYGILTVVGVVATAALILFPGDGPVGDYAAGTATMRAAAGVVARSGMTQLLENKAKIKAAQMMQRIFSGGTQFKPAF